MRVIAVIDAVGTALTLQILSLIASIGIVTALPASIAMQRQLEDAAVGEKTGVVSYAREFGRSWRQAWMPGVFLPVLAGGAVVSVAFWSAVKGPVGPIATGVVVFLGGVVLSVYLATLKQSQLDRGSAWPTWVGHGFAALVAMPLRGLWATIMLIGWISLSLYFPTLLLVGSALIPALIVRWCLADPARELDVDAS